MYNNNVRLAKKIAIGTIISGLIFLAAFYFTYEMSYVYGGIFFGLGVAAIVVTIMISGMIASSRQNHKPAEKSKTILWNVVSLVSILVYTLIGLMIVNSSRIIVKNNLDSPVENIYITGCQDFEVGKIQANSSKTIFINYFKNISDNCIVEIRYTTENSIKEDILVVSAKPFKGEKIIYEIN